MIEIERTDSFIKWYNKLKDQAAKAKIATAVVRMQKGLLGDVKPVGAGVSEYRIHYAKGYRIYFVKRGDKLIILLAGGTKASQKADIEKAKLLYKLWEKQ